MKGLLDFLNSDEAALGLGLLAAGGPTTDPNASGFGQRLAAGVGYAQNNASNRTKQEYIRSQMAENEAQTAARRQQLALAERKQRMNEGLLGFDPLGAAPAAPAGGPAGAPSAPGGGGGAPNPFAAPGAAGAGGTPAPTTAVQTPRGPRTLQQLSQAFNIPFESLAFDLVQNDGKGIAEMVFKASQPDMAVTDGFAYDKKKLQGGFLPGVTQSQDGKSTTRLIGPDGLPTVQATPGALGAYSRFEDAKNSSGADYATETVLNGAGEKITRRRSAVLRDSDTAPAGPTPPPLIGPGVGSGRGPVNGERITNALAPRAGEDDRAAIYAQERRQAAQRLQEAQAAGDTLGASRAQSDLNGIEREIRSNRINLPPLGATPAPLIGPGAGRGSQGMTPAAAAPAPAAAAPAAAPLVTAGNVTELSPAAKRVIESEDSFSKALTSQAAGTVESARTGAVSAKSTLDNVRQIRDGLGNAILGPGASTRVTIGQIGQALGITGKDNAEQLANTRSVMSGLAKQELSASGALKGQGTLTESERDILKKAESGKIDELTKPELQALLGALERSANNRIGAYGRVLDKVKAGAKPAEFLELDDTPAAAKPLAGGWSVKVK